MPVTDLCRPSSDLRHAFLGLGPASDLNSKQDSQEIVIVVSPGYSPGQCDCSYSLQFFAFIIQLFLLSPSDSTSFNCLPPPNLLFPCPMLLLMSLVLSIPLPCPSLCNVFSFPVSADAVEGVERQVKENGITGRGKTGRGLVKLKAEDRQWKSKPGMEKKEWEIGGRSKRSRKKESRREWREWEAKLGLVWKETPWQKRWRLWG